MHRLFVALRPPPPIRAGLSALMEGIAGARWQDDDQLHITLRYIGEVDGPTAHDIAFALAQVHATAIEVAVCGTGVFDNYGRINTLWAGIEPADALTALHRKVDHALVRVGLPPEGRSYLPHITLARFSRGTASEVDIARWRLRNAALATPPFVLEHLVLYESVLLRDGAVYETIARWPLG